MPPKSDSIKKLLMDDGKCIKKHDGKTFEEISQIMGLPSHVVEYAFYTAIKKLQRHRSRLEKYL